MVISVLLFLIHLFMGKDKEWSGLMKVPAEEIIKELRMELGKANAYIAELESIVNDYKILDTKKENIVRLKALETELSRVKSKLDDTRNRLADSEKIRDHFKKELFKSIKTQL